MGRRKKNINVKKELEQGAIKMTEESAVTETVESVVNDSNILLENLETDIDLKRLELEKLKLEVEEKRAEMVKIPRRELTADEKVLHEKHMSINIQHNGLKAIIEKQKEFDSRLVRGKFMNRRSPGSSVKLTYLKYETDQPKWWVFDDGKTYTIPRGFADQINEHYYRPRFIENDQPMDPNEPGSSIHAIDTSNKLYAFVPDAFAA